MPPARRKLFLAVIENGASDADSALAALPVEIHAVPVSRIVRCADNGQLAEISARVGEFDWVLLSSANAATIFFDLVDVPLSGSPLIACVGPNTAACVRQLGYSVDFVSSEHRGDAFAEEFACAHGASPITVLLPRPEKMGSQLVERLTRAGIAVTQMILYRTEALPPESLPDLDLHASDLFAFMSPSGARHFGRRYAIPKGTAVFAIGPTTAAALVELGCDHVRTADEFSRDGLLDAVRAFLDNESQPEEETI
jgi:uroporphyrinogen-III synthase